MADALVVLPPPLVALFPGAERRVALSGRTVGELVDALDGRWPGIRDRICEGVGPAARPRRHLRLFVAGEPADLATSVPDGATVHVLMAISGG